MTKAVKKLMWLVEGIVTSMFAISVLIIIAHVFWRYVLIDPITWSNQIVRALFCWMTYLGIPCLFNRNVMMSFDLIQDMLPERQHDLLKIFFRILGILFCVAWLYFSMKLCLAKTSVGKFFPGLIPFIGQIPKNALYGAQPVCCVLMIIVFVSQIFELIKDYISAGKVEKKEAAE